MAALIAGMAVMAARARRITTAERRVRRSLQDDLFTDVGPGELREIRQTLASLPVHEATAVVGRLSEHELGVWMRELDGRRGGLSSAEQDDLFSSLAQRIRPEQLARIAAAGNLQPIVEAAAVRSPVGWRSELALRLWSNHSPDDRGWAEIVILVETIPPSALAGGLASVRPDVVASALVAPYERYGAATPVLDVEAATRFLGAVAALQDARMKADLFASFAARVHQTDGTSVRGPTGRSGLLGALAGLLISDPAGMVAELNHRVDPHANIVSEWVAGMIRHDRIDELDVLLVGLAGAPDRLAHFTDPGPDPAYPYPNAANLGYYAGAYSRAIDIIADRAGDRIELVARLFTLFAGLVPVPGGARLGLPLSPLVDVHAASTLQTLRDGAADVKQTLWGLAKPRTADGRLWNGAGTSQFQDAWQEVVDVR